MLIVACAVLLALVFLSPGCKLRRQPTIAPVEKLPQPIIRVKLAGPADKIIIAVDGPFTVYNSDSREIFTARKLSLAYCYADKAGIVIGDKRIGGSDFCDIVPQINGTLSLNRRYYRGSLRIYRTSDAKILAVNHVRIEDYLKGVLPGELPRRFELETFKAQAICARTFALYEKVTLRSSRRWDVFATEASQVYLGKSVEISKANRAVDATRGIVLTAKRSNGRWQIFPTYYSSTCGGWTQSASNIANISSDIKPLRGGVRCMTCKISPYYRWSDRRISADEITQALKKHGLLPADVRTVTDVRVIRRTRHGRIAMLEIVADGERRLKISGERFRLIIGSRKMPSTFCDIEKSGREYMLTHGRGLGHGVGMCQYGAEGLAREGYTALEILSHYYPGSKPVRVY